MPSAWDDATERKLLLTMMHLTMPKLPDWDAVAVLMGDTFTGNACRQRFQKLRNECKEKFGEAGEVPEGTPAKATPRKKSTASPKKTTTAKSSDMPTKGKAKVNGKRKERYEDAEEETEEPAAKKTVKAEESDELD